MCSSCCRRFRRRKADLLIEKLSIDTSSVRLRLPPSPQGEGFWVRVIPVPFRDPSSLRSSGWQRKGRWVRSFLSPVGEADLIVPCHPCTQDVYYCKLLSVLYLIKHKSDNSFTCFFCGCNDIVLFPIWLRHSSWVWVLCFLPYHFSFFTFWDQLALFIFVYNDMKGFSVNHNLFSYRAKTINDLS